MFPAYLAIGFLNIFAQHHNYGINNTHMDLRVRRDIRHTHIPSDMQNIYPESGQYIHTNRNSIKSNDKNWRNNYVWNKIRSQKNKGIHKPKYNVPHYNPVSGKRLNETGKYRSHHTIMPRYNMTGFNSGSLYPGSHYNATAYNRHTLKNVNTNTGSSQPGIQTPANSNAKYVVSNVTGVGISTLGSGIPPVTPSSEKPPVTPGKEIKPLKKIKKKIRACVMCSIPCPSGRHRDESGLYCVKDDPEE